ncbi:MAG: helix-turn-helix domain-containing protein [Rhizobacter sp.]
MTEVSNPAAQESPERPTAGSLLRQARQARGLHIAALATSIKVPPRTLELLEADRYDELLDLTFARALAQTVCRSLKIDPVPVLDLIPKVTHMGLGHVDAGINEPFSSRSGHARRPSRPESRPWSQVLKPQWLLPGIVLIGAVVVYFFPGHWPAGEAGTSPVAVEGSLLPSPAIASAPLAEVQGQPAPVELLPAAEGASGAVAAIAPVAPRVSPLPGVSLLELRPNQNAWVEVQDASNKSLISRLVLAGEVVNLDGTLPLRLKLGNAASISVRFRGELVDLTPSTRDNVARIELK